MTEPQAPAPIGATAANPETRPDYATKRLFVGEDGRACVVWAPQRRWETLVRHLHNGKTDRDFVAIWCGETGQPVYRRNWSKTLADAMGRAWRTIRGRAKAPFSFAVYSNNGRGHSRWGCLDFDAHGGDLAAAWVRAFRCFETLKARPGVATILEHSGRGYHLWAVAEDFRAVETWGDFLRDVATAGRAEVAAGVCEIQPERHSRTGKAVRAPGTWNPTTGTCGEIIFENCGALLDALEAKAPAACHATSLSCNYESADSSAHAGDIARGGDGASCTTRENTVVLSSAHQKEARALTGGIGGAAPPAGVSSGGANIPDGLAGAVLRAFRIEAPGTRHNRLVELVGMTFNAFGVDVARGIAREQFEAAAVRPQADAAEHFREFESLWQGLCEKDAAGFSEAERASHAALQTGHQRDAFRIVRAFQYRAREKGEPDFPVSVQSMAQRLGVTVAGATKIRNRLAEVGAIRQTAAARINRAAARFEWLG